MNSNKDKQKFSIIYQITNLIDGRIYIGAHVTYNINDEYKGSSKYLKKDIKELGWHNFKKDILYVFYNKEDMMKKENELVNREFCNRSDTYNLMIGGSFNFNDMVTVKDKDGNTSKVYLDNPLYLSGDLVGVTKGTVTTKDKNGIILQVDKNDIRYLSGELIPIATGLPSSCSMLGRNHSEETKEKLRNYKRSEETKEKMSKSLIGRIPSFLDKHHSNESKEKMSNSKKGKQTTTMLGKHHSDESKRKMRSTKLANKLLREAQLQV